MQEFLTTFSYLAVSQLLLTGLFFLCYYRRTRLGFLIFLLCVCLIAANWSPFAGTDYRILAYIDGRIAAATPAILWLFAHALFVDDKKVNPLAWLLLIGYQIPRGFVAFPEQIYDFAGNPILQILNPICLLIAFGLAVHVIVMAIREIGNDLLEERRRLRGPFAAGLGIVMAMLVATLLTPEFLSESAATQFGQFATAVSRLVTFFFFLIFNLVTFRLTAGSQFIVDSAMLQLEAESSSQLQLAETDKQMMKELDRRMVEEKLFAEQALTIGKLARLLAIQEYKLRLFINRELGYKNFSQFLNHYRINEACELLKKKSRHRNIAIVAQDVGYASLSTFNQAFKKLKGITPSEYKIQYTVSE